MDSSGLMSKTDHCWTELTLNNTGKGCFLYWDGNELVESFYLFHLGESQSIQLGNHSQPCWRPTPWPLAFCFHWWPTFQVLQSHRSGRDAGHWCGHHIRQHNHICKDDHSQGPEPETRGRPPSPEGPKESWFRWVNIILTHRAWCELLKRVEL